MELPPLYAILDKEVAAQHGYTVAALGAAFLAGGVKLLQYRNKSGSARDILRDAALLHEMLLGSGCLLVMNDRADLAMLARCDGVHLGQTDLGVEDARRIVGSGSLIGVSTHTDQQVSDVDGGGANYVAIGPVFQTGTKPDAAAVVGLAGVRRARARTAKPLVAIGGITRTNARSVLDAGADSLAMVSELVREDEGPEKVARDFLHLFR